MQQVTVFVGGSVGSDPWSDRTWSGSSASMLRAMQSKGLLAAAAGIEVPSLLRKMLLLKNFNISRPVWRQHFYADPAYRNALTKAAARVGAKGDVLMQLGSMFSLPEAYPSRKCISYHDGNLVERLKSGFNLEGISSRRIDQALRYEERVSCAMTAVFTFSEYLRQSFIRDYHVPPGKVFNVGGGINLTRIPDADEVKDYSIPRLLFIGSEFGRKGGPILLEAFAAIREAIPEAELHIAGPRQMAEIPAGVFFHGHLVKSKPEEAERLDRLFRSATLFVLPSLYEPFGIAPLEAMLHRVPCVVTGEWALAETVRDGVNGALIRKGSASELAATVIRLLRDPQGLAAMGARARERALSEYTWPVVVERMAGVIGTL